MPVLLSGCVTRVNTRISEALELTHIAFLCWLPLASLSNKRKKPASS
ncbi:hypothetical protein MGSAQ_002727 [marine sediment metagenome]|uniref:Uncharacterized protein n=1 Tax=marine sediment metagenome TaxID=412755 RepID=A0A1B6NSR6_9ZZZZ